MRKHLVWVLGLALAIGIANVAVGANFQKITGTFKPNTNLSKTKFKAGSPSRLIILKSSCMLSAWIRNGRLLIVRSVRSAR